MLFVGLMEYLFSELFRFYPMGGVSMEKMERLAFLVDKMIVQICLSILTFFTISCNSLYAVHGWTTVLSTTFHRRTTSMRTVTRLFSLILALLIAAACRKDGLAIKLFVPMGATGIQMYGSHNRSWEVDHVVNPREGVNYYRPRAVVKAPPSRIQFTVPLVHHVGCEWAPDLRVTVNDVSYDVLNADQPLRFTRPGGQEFLTCYYTVAEPGT